MNDYVVYTNTRIQEPHKFIYYVEIYILDIRTYMIFTINIYDFYLVY